MTANPTAAKLPMKPPPPAAEVAASMPDEAVRAAAEHLGVRASALDVWLQGRWWTDGQIALRAFAGAQSSARASRLDCAARLWAWQLWPTTETRGILPMVARYRLQPHREVGRIWTNEHDVTRFRAGALDDDCLEERVARDYVALASDAAGAEWWTLTPAYPASECARKRLPDDQSAVCGWRGSPSHEGELVACVMPYARPRRPRAEGGL